MEMATVSSNVFAPSKNDNVGFLQKQYNSSNLINAILGVHSDVIRGNHIRSLEETQNSALL